MQGDRVAHTDQARAGLAQALGQVLVFTGAQAFIEATDSVEPLAAQQQVGRR
ncbi:hypothetical protein D9M72_611100 [compost metagenome]